MKTKKILFGKSNVVILFSTLVMVTSFLFIITTEVFSSEPPVWTYYVDSDKCVGCGACEAVAPECFIVVNGKASVIWGWWDYPDLAEEAYESCPHEAIGLTSY